jgi:hypothetical protein
MGCIQHRILHWLFTSVLIANTAAPLLIVSLQTTVWAMWTIPVIFLSLWLLMDCLFIDDKAFIFDHDYEVCRALRCKLIARLTSFTIDYLMCL